MPDKYCKNCYGCEEAFTMYRRRHHCRMCGQVFCNNCSSFYIDGSLFNVTGLVRACELCYEQLMERTERENRLNRRKQSDRFNTNSTDHFRSFVPPALTNNKTGSSVSSLDDRSKIHSNNLQNRYV